MTLLVGLTRKLYQEYDRILNILEQLQTTVEEAASIGLLNKREQQIIKMVEHVQNHPEENLWNKKNLF